MSYHFKPGESIPKNIKRIAHDQLASAIDYLGAKGSAKHDEAIHSARKCVKKLRALTRLVRSGLGDEYPNISGRLVEVGHTLSELRDAQALITTLDTIRSQHRKALANGSLTAIRKSLLARKRRIDQEKNTPQLLRELAAELEKVQKNVKGWPLELDGFAAIDDGLENAFARGRKAMTRAGKHERAEDFHEWRKRVKDHWYHVRLLRDLWTDVVKGYAVSLENLETWLGDDHNLSLLHDEIASAPETYGNDRDVAKLFRTIGRSQDELRKCALSLGEKVYHPKPRRLIRQIRNMWDIWAA